MVNFPCFKFQLNCSTSFSIDDQVLNMFAHMTKLKIIKVNLL